MAWSMSYAMRSMALIVWVPESVRVLFCNETKGAFVLAPVLTFFR